MRKNGFTIIELVIVLVIIGLSASIAAPNLMKDIRKARFKNDLKKVFSTIRYARSRAIFSGRKQSVSFDEKNGEFWIDGLGKMKLFDDVSFRDIKVVRLKDDEEKIKKFVFNTNGSASSGEITVAMGRDEAVIEVQSFDSRVVIK